MKVLTIQIGTCYNIPYVKMEVTEVFYEVDETAYYVRYLRFYYCHWLDTSAGGPFDPEGIIFPVVSVSALTWFIRYIYIIEINKNVSCEIN
jgi:hypothetical protein